MYTYVDTYLYQVRHIRPKRPISHQKTSLQNIYSYVYISIYIWYDTCVQTGLYQITKRLCSVYTHIYLYIYVCIYMYIYICICIYKACHCGGDGGNLAKVKPLVRNCTGTQRRLCSGFRLPYLGCNHFLAKGTLQQDTKIVATRPKQHIHHESTIDSSEPMDRATYMKNTIAFSHGTYNRTTIFSIYMALSMGSQKSMKKYECVCAISGAWQQFQ